MRLLPAAILALTWPAQAAAQVTDEAIGGYDHALAPLASATRLTGAVSVDVDP
jgi:hypothetical protein